jgi:hypothetical protein
VGGSRITDGNLCTILVGKPEGEKNHLEEIEIGGRIISKQIFKNRA